jgi:hypothetical protein
MDRNAGTGKPALRLLRDVRAVEQPPAQFVVHGFLLRVLSFATFGNGGGVWLSVDAPREGSRARACIVCVLAWLA